MYGWFDSPEQEVPAYDPGPNIDCPFCKESLTCRAVTTISLCAQESSRSYFYRVHKDCYEAGTPEERQFYDHIPLTVHPDISQEIVS